MSVEIKNETETPERRVLDRPTVVRSATDLQRLKLEKLMKHPDKQVIIPEKPKERGIPAVPEFVRNVMGSSAGAGSGEFHVYRHLRRKEYARQKFMKEKGERERLEDEYHEKLEDYKRKAEEKTAKKRAKRLKRKAKKGNKKTQVKQNESTSESEDSASENEEKTEEEEPKEEDAKEDVEQIKEENDEEIIKKEEETTTTKDTTEELDVNAIVT